MTARQPDFLLIGAMKAGTTTLHHALAAHPRVFVPEAELFVLDADDFTEHAEAFRSPEGGWRPVVFTAEGAQARWTEAFEAAGPDQLLGEDSTTYLSSVLAPARAAALLPEARILVSLRDPVDRAWSHYWHLVRSGRMSLRFEDALVAGQGTLLHRSRYAPALSRWVEVFGRERVHVEVFEEYLADPQAGLDRVGAFLGLDPPPQHHELSAGDQHRHRGRRPRFVGVQRAANWVARQPMPGQGVTAVAAPTRRGGGRPWVARGLDRLAGTEAVEGTPAMDPETRALLQGVLGRDNVGLEALVGRPLKEWWPWLGG